MERFGRIDTLINNAGIFIPKPFVDYSLHDFTSMIGDPSGRNTTRPPLTREQIGKHRPARFGLS